MRLTMLLDTYERTTQVPSETQNTEPSHPSSKAVLPTSAVPATIAAFGDSNAQFNSLLDGLLPCRTEDSELWFAEQAPDVVRAKELCQACPMQAGCLQGALDRAEPWGVWGGEVLVNGQVVAVKRGRGRPKKMSQG